MDKEIFKGKSFSDLLEDIYTNSIKKEKQIFSIRCNKYKPPKPWKGPIEITINFLFKRPVSHIKKNGELRKNAPEQHIYKPDIDNLVKFVLDSLSGTFFDDDKQVVIMHTTKAYDFYEDLTLIKINKLIL